MNIRCTVNIGRESNVVRWHVGEKGAKGKKGEKVYGGTGERSTREIKA
jgi:hypothetical protein